MIAFLTGKVAGRSLVSVFLDVNGVGYEVGMSQSSLSRVPEVGQLLTVFTHLQVRDDGLSLFGFLSEDEKALFERLIGVSGVGPKVALAALSTYQPHALVELIASQDVSAVQRIPGIGKKTASRIILELKGSFDSDGGNLFAAAAAAVEQASSVNKANAHEALLSMGFTDSEAELALKDAPEGASESVLVQYALKRLGS